MQNEPSVRLNQRQQIHAPMPGPKRASINVERKHFRGINSFFFPVSSKTRRRKKSRLFFFVFKHQKVHW